MSGGEPTGSAVSTPNSLFHDGDTPNSLFDEDVGNDTAVSIGAYEPADDGPGIPQPVSEKTSQLDFPSDDDAGIEAPVSTGPIALANMFDDLDDGENKQPVSKLASKPDSAYDDGAGIKSPVSKPGRALKDLFTDSEDDDAVRSPISKRASKDARPSAPEKISKTAILSDDDARIKRPVRKRKRALTPDFLDNDSGIQAPVTKRKRISKADSSDDEFRPSTSKRKRATTPNSSYDFDAGIKPPVSKRKRIGKQTSSFDEEAGTKSAASKSPYKPSTSSSGAKSQFFKRLAKPGSRLGSNHPASKGIAKPVSLFERYTRDNSSGPSILERNVKAKQAGPKRLGEGDSTSGDDVGTGKARAERDAAFSKDASKPETYDHLPPAERAAARKASMAADLATIRAKAAEIEADETTAAVTFIGKVWRVPRFFHLPPKIRQRIYRYAMFPHGGTLGIHFSKNNTYNNFEPPLLRTCHAMRDEARTMFYRNLEISAPEVEDLFKFLGHIGPLRIILPRICLYRDEGDPVNTTHDLQQNRYWRELKQAGYEVRRTAIKVVRQA